MKILPDHKNLVYSGRIDWSSPTEPVFIYPCTSVRFRFTGNVLKVHVNNRNAYWDNYLGCILDGRQTSAPLPKEGNAVIELKVQPKDTGEHEALLFKRQDACHELAFLGVELSEDGQLIPAPEGFGRKIEVYGDSVSAGEVSEAVAYTGKEDPEHHGEFSNSWYSFAWMTARKLNAQIHNIAQGGIALMDHTGWFYEPQAIGMETVWNKVRYNPQFGDAVEWDFSRYTPQAVIVAVGQNDNHPRDYMKEDYDGEQAVRWRSRYRAFLSKLRQKYPDAWIVCCTTLLCHDEAWDRSIGQAVRELDDPKITQYLFKHNGAKTPGHLRISEAAEMAAELAGFLENLNLDGWNQ